MLASHEIISLWRENPVVFARQVFNVELEPWQQDVAMAFPKHNCIAMMASKGPGKTFMEALLAWNFLWTRPDPKIPAISNSGDNLATNLWPEMAMLMNLSPMTKEQFEWTKTKIYLKSRPETHFMVARSFPRSASPIQQADALAGIHGNYILFIIDEAGSIVPAVLATAEAALSTGKECKIVMAGNTTSKASALYSAAVRDRAKWYVISVNGDPDNPKRAQRVSKKWAQDQIDKYGRDNPWVKVNVFGEFPDEAINTLLTVEEVLEAQSRKIPKQSYDFSQIRLGIDVARFGLDRTVLFKRQGLVSFKPHVMQGAKTDQIAGRAALMKSEEMIEVIFIDGTGGFGAGVADSLSLAKIEALEVHASGKPIDSQYYNKRAECWYEMGKFVKKGSLPNDPDLVRELTEITYTFRDGKLIMESKDQLKERLGYSPDKADALSLTFALPDMPAKLVIPGVRIDPILNHKPPDWDPYANA